MVGRQQKTCDQSDEIEVIDDDAPKRRGQKSLKLKKSVKEPEKRKGKLTGNDSDLLADFDLEGVSETEKNEIMKAIKLSKESEQKSHKTTAVLDETGDENGTNSYEFSPQQKLENKDVSGDGIMDMDDETQPPDSPLQEEFKSDEKPNLEQAQAPVESKLTSRTKDKDDSSVYDNSTIVDEKESQRATSPTLDYDLHMSVSQDPHDDLDGDDDRHREKEIDSGKFLNTKSFMNMFTTKQKPSDLNSNQSSQQAGHNSNSFERSQSSLGSLKEDESKQSQMALSQGSGSVESQMSEEQRVVNEDPSSHPLPLKRHYRNVTKQAIHQQKYFATDQIDPLVCTKAIIQLFDTYAKNLRAAQAKLTERIPWGDPVKSGQHQSKTIDMKRRGQESQYMILSDSEEEDIKSVKKGEVDTADTVKAQEKKNETETSGRRRRFRDKINNKDILTAETQPIAPNEYVDKNTNQSFDDLDDKDFYPNTYVRMSRQSARQRNQVENKTATHDENKMTRKDESKVYRGRGRRKNNAKVLVEDTQKDVYDISSDEENKEKTYGRVVVEESQLPDVDDNEKNTQQRNVSKENHKSRPGFSSLLSRHNEPYGINSNNNSSLRTSNRENFNIGDKKENSASEKNNQANQNVRSNNKGKSFKKEIVTLVEDTQDIDNDVLDNDMQSEKQQKVSLRSIRSKRKSFQLKSDSEEEDSVPETQEMNLSPDVTVIENKVNGKEAASAHKDSKGFFTNTVGSVFNKIKNYISPKAQVDDHADGSQRVGDEESQSPVIKKRRKLYKESDSKVDKNPEKFYGDTDFQSVHQNTRTFRGKRGIAFTEDVERETVAKEDMTDALPGPGVKRLISRPSSKESNASDEVSLTNSQGSSTLLDEQGDLYCTQINEKPDLLHRKRFQRGTKAGTHAENVKNNFDDIIENNREDHIKVKLLKKDYSKRKPYNKKPGIITLQSENIRNFFPKIPQDRVIIYSDSDSSDNSEMPASHAGAKYTHNKNSNRKHKIAQQIDDEDPLAGVNVKARTTSQKRVVTLPRVKVPRTVLDNDNNNDGHPTEHIEKLLPNRSRNDEQIISSENSFNANCNLESVHENIPIKPSHFVDQITASCKESSECFGGARPKVLRTRKVSETITSGQLEETNSWSNRKNRREWVTEHPLGDQAKPELGDAVRKKDVNKNQSGMSLETKNTYRNKYQSFCFMETSQPRGLILPRKSASRDVAAHFEVNCTNVLGLACKGAAILEINKGMMKTENIRKLVSPVGRVSPVVMMPCPLCNQKFSQEMIQIHASECVGIEEGDEEEEPRGTFAGVAHRLRGHHEDQAHSLSNKAPDHHCNNIPHHVKNIHLNDFDEDEEELHGYMNFTASQNPVKIDDSDVHDVAKHIKISPGEPGEIQSCYVCDAMIPKGVALEQHIQHCLLEAKQQQMEVDKEGFNKVFCRVNQPAEPDTPRTTRRQLRSRENLVTIRMDPEGRVEDEAGYSSGNSAKSEGTSYGSSWSEGSESDSSVEENVTLASIVRPAGSAALITGPWNEKRSTNKQVTQSADGSSVPDWVNNPSHSPIRSFVPISQQEDSEYFTKQFQYKKERVERQMNKRKRSQSRKKGRRHRKRRKVSKKISKTKASKT